MSRNLAAVSWTVVSTVKDRVKDHSRDFLKDKHLVRVRMFWGIGSVFLSLTLSFFHVIPTHVEWPQVIIIGSLACGFSCLLLRRDHFWTITCAATGMFLPLVTIAPFWSELQYGTSVYLKTLADTAPNGSGGWSVGAMLAFTAAVGSLLGIGIVRISQAMEFVERFKRARAFCKGTAKASKDANDEIAQEWAKVNVEEMEIPLEVRLLLRRNERDCIQEIEEFKKRSKIRLDSPRYKRRKPNKKG